MNDIAELQKIWMTKGDEAANGTKEPVPDSIMNKLKSLETYQNRINRIKIVVITVLLLSLLLILASAKVYSTYKLLGFGVILASVAIFMIYYLKNQFKTSKLDFTSGSINFTESTLKALQNQNAIFKVPFIIFFISIVSGLNLSIYGGSADLTTDEMITLYLFNNIFVIACGIIGYRIRLWRIKKEVTPLIDELTKVKESLGSER
ncbi:MAG: hypothetical protein HXX16_16180 [Bacteroidales bacterium]|nr:hypothetical protein [Bacteroidales bacterium]